MKHYFKNIFFFALALTFIIPSEQAFAIPTYEDACQVPLIQAGLTVGNQNQDVRDLQSFLVEHNFLSDGSVSGYYGPLTRQAVREFQASQNIVSSGTAATTGYGAVGVRTQAAINTIACGDVGGSNGTTTQNPTTNYAVRLTADRTSVNPGDKVTLTYTRTLDVPNTTRTCKLADTTGTTYETMDSRNPANGTRAVYPFGTTTYKFNCSYNIAGFTVKSVDDFVNVVVGDDTTIGNAGAPVISMSVSQTSVSAGASPYIALNVQNGTATRCTITTSPNNPAWNATFNGAPNLPQNNSIQVNNVQTTTTFSGTCVDSLNRTSNNASVIVTVGTGGSPTSGSVDLKVNASDGPISIIAGTPIILSWTATPASLECKGSGSPAGIYAFGGSGGNLTSGFGSQQIPVVTSTTVYTVICTPVGGGQSVSDSVTVNVGTGGSGNAPVVTMSASQTSVSAGASPFIALNVQSGTAVRCTITTSPNNSAWNATFNGAPNLPQNNSIQVNNVQTTTTFSGTCVDSLNRTSNNASVIVTVGTGGTGTGTQPSVILTASATNVSSGQGPSLAWSSRNVTSCTASEGPSNSWAGSWTGSKPTSGFQQSTGGLSNPSNIYILTCTGPNGTASDRVEVRVSAGGNSPTINSFTAVGGAVAGIPPFKFQTWTFNWSATGAIYCALSSPTQGVNFTGQLPVSGSKSLSIFTDETYTLSCPAAIGAVVPTATAQYSVLRNLNAAGPSVSFNSSATSASTNQPVTLTWSSIGATACYGGGDGSFSLYGNSLSGSKALTFYSPGTFTMTLRCDSANGGSTTQTATVIVTQGTGNTTQSQTPTAANPSGLTVDIEADNSDGPVNITAGQSVRLSWGTAPNALIYRMVCRASGGNSNSIQGDSINWSGYRLPVDTFTARPTQSTTYTISCQDNAQGYTAVDSVTVNVIPLNPSLTVVAPTLGQTGVSGNVQLSAVFNAQASSVVSGQSTTLTWSALYSNTCEISADGVVVNAGGAAFGNMSTGALTKNTTFTLSCYRWVTVPAPVYSTKAYAPTQSVTVSVTTPTQGSSTSGVSTNYSGSGVTLDLRANNMKGSVTTTASSAAVNLSYQLLSNNSQELIGWTCKGDTSFVRPSVTTTYIVTCTSFLTNQVISDSVTVNVI